MSCVASRSGARMWAMSAAVPTVGWPANGSSRAGVKILARAVLTGFLGSNANTVSDRFNSRAIACIRRSSRPSLSRTTASGLPASAVSAKTSSVKKRRVIGEDLTPPYGRSRERLRDAAARHGEVVRQPIEAAHADKGVVDVRHELSRRGEGVERVAIVFAGERARAGRQPGFTGVNDDLASLRGRMTRVTMDRLSVGGDGQSEDDAERGGAESSDRTLHGPFLSLHARSLRPERVLFCDGMTEK